MKAIICSIFIFLSVTRNQVLSQIKNIRFEHIGTAQKLSQSNVICILQDSRGYMWFGTRDGLNKYDGYKFTVFKNDPSDPNSISNNFIRAIVEDNDGDLWIATLDGLCRYIRESNQFINYRHDPNNNYSISSNLITSISIDKSSPGNIWVGTEDGLNMFEVGKKQFVHYSHNKNDEKSLSDGFIRNIYSDSKHGLWIGTMYGGLNLFDPKNKAFSHFQHNEQDKNSISCNNVYTMFEDSKHQLWIGTNGGGLELFNRANGKFAHFKHDDSHNNSLAGNSVYAINEDNQNNLWVGTENGGLSIFNPLKGMFYTYRNDISDNASLSNNSIYSIYKDSKSNIWLGTFNGGVDMVNPDAQRFAHYKHMLFKNSLSNNNVLCFYEDAQKGIWIGTDGGGLNLFDPVSGLFTHFGHEKNNINSIGGDYVLSVCQDSKGNIWIGTWGDGVTVFNRSKHTFSHYRHNVNNPSSLSNDNAWKIFEDKEKNIWIGTYGGGLNLYNPANNSFTNYQYSENNKTGISSNNIQSILENEEGKLWISADGGGLNLFDKKNKQFSHFLHDKNKNSIINNSTGTLYEDKNKNLWIGTMAGLSMFDQKSRQFINYTTTHGLPNNVIFGILEDDSGNLWISTNNGISRFNPANKIFKNFGAADGLQSNEFKQQAYCKTDNGTMYFGGNNGFNQFNPDSIKSDSFDPPLVITGFQIFNKDLPISADAANSPLQKDISESNGITISYKSSVISFEFASLNYTISEKKQYEYMLEGFDAKWNDIGTRRTATYTNLDPGKYVFKVRGLNNDGSRSHTIKSFFLTITPPFWLTWWFKMLTIIFIACLFITFYQMRMKKIKKQKAELEKLVKQRTEEVVQQKGEILKNMAELEENQEQMKQNVRELAALQESLEKEKYFLDSLMDNMPDAIYFKDRESKMIRVSKFMADRFNTTVDDLIGKYDYDFKEKAHAQNAYLDEQTIQKTRMPKIDYLEKETMADGSDHWVSTTKMPLINAKDEVVGTFGISRDVTKIKMLEQERHAAIVDKAVAQGKFEIASDVMHDIGNAVVGFGSYLNRIQRLQSENSPENLRNLACFFEKQKAEISTVIGESKAKAVVNMLDSMARTQASNQDEIAQSITAQLNIISNIQEILAIQRQYISGHESQERKAVNIPSVINDAVSMLFGSLDRIDVSIDIPKDLPVIKGDRTKLIQVLLNLLKNSIEAIDKDAVQRTISITANSSNGSLVLQVKDSGNGFDQSVLEKIFNRGYTTKSSGGGLGLYNCKAIIESHDGTIDIVSDGFGKGALATIRMLKQPA